MSRACFGSAIRRSKSQAYCDGCTRTSRLLRQYLPKATDLSKFSQAELDAIAWQLNTRPRKNLDWKCPAELFMPESFDFFQHHHQLVALRT